MLWEYNSLESDFGSTLMQIENNGSLAKVYTASLLNTCTRGQKLGIHKITIAQKRTVENGGEERRGDAWCDLKV